MRASCPTCYRPVDLCLCADLPRVANRTGIVVLQHVREHLHPFGSARMLVQSLRRSELRVVRGPRPAAATAGRFPQVSLHHAMAVPPRTGLLYPHPDARLLGALEPDELPDHLVLLDGTWAHAKRIYDDNPWLHDLPHYAIAPRRPSRYLVRREPRPECVSTLEAAVEALQRLEPELAGTEALLALFARMNLEQVARREAATTRRS